MNKNTKIRFIVIGGVISSIAIVAICIWWFLYTSYSTVTFIFDNKNGHANIASTTTGEMLIYHQQPVRLKKGDYTLNSFGDNIRTASATITINESSQKIPVSFHYTTDYLATIYQKEAPRIRVALLQAYPNITQLYTISGSALYEKGQYYGAKLTYRDTTSAQRDSLRVLLKKEGDTWRVLSNPPVPILSAPLFPEVDRSTLETINRVK